MHNSEIKQAENREKSSVYNGGNYSIFSQSLRTENISKLYPLK